MFRQQLRRNLTGVINPDNSQINNRDIHENVYDRFLCELETNLCELGENKTLPIWKFFKNLSNIISGHNSFSINAGGTAWENFYNSQPKEEKNREEEKAFTAVNSDIFVFCDEKFFPEKFKELDDNLNQLEIELNKLSRTFNQKQDMPGSVVGQKRTNYHITGDKISFTIEKSNFNKDNRPTKTILFPCYSFIVEYEKYDYTTHTNVKGHILYVSFFPVKSRSPNDNQLNFNDFKIKFTESYIETKEETNYLNNSGLHFFGNKIDGNRSLEKGMNIDKIRMNYLMNYYKSQGELPEFHKIYEKVFSETDLYSCYDKIKLNHLYFASIVDPIKTEIKKSVVQCFREYSYLILKDIENEFVSQFGKDKSITLLVGGESMSFYNITKREDTDDYDIKVFYDKDVKNSRERAKKIIYEILSKYVVLLKEAFPLENILSKHKDVSLKSKTNSLARLRLIKSICKDYDLFSIDFKIIVEKSDIKEIESIAIDIPILDVSIVKKDIDAFKNIFSDIPIQYRSPEQEINITKDVDIIISGEGNTEDKDDNRNAEMRQGSGVPITGQIEFDPEQVENYFSENTKEMEENITDKYFEDIDSQKVEEDDDDEKQEVMVDQVMKDEEQEVRKQEVREDEKQWKIKIPTLLYYIYDYYYMYGNRNNKKLRILAQKNKKDEERYLSIKEKIATDLNEHIKYEFNYNPAFSNFLNLSHNYNQNNMPDIKFYITKFENLMKTAPLSQQKIRMKFKIENSEDRFRSGGGGENNQYSYFLADLFQNILDSIFFYHKSF
jgi:hypothetical protein